MGSLLRARATVVLILIVGALAFGGVAIPLTNHPKFCASCHNIQPSHDSWVKSSHKEVTCVTCHVRPGIEGWIHDKAWAGTKDVAIYLFGKPTESYNLKAKVDSPVCFDCHQHVLRTSEVAPRDLPAPVKDVGLVMSHRKHMEAFTVRGRGEGCTTCHAGVVHDQPIKNYSIVVPRGHVAADNKPWIPDYPEGSYLHTRALNDCFRCHDGTSEHQGKVLDRKCETCHLPDKIKTFLTF